jgi:NAD+ synthase (glutamine-hydrolysing)
MTSLNNNRIVTLATCNLNQWAMDFKGNYTRIKESIVQAKESGASYRLGPELEITGYGCEDHFLETDTFIHAWEILGQILDSDLTDNILCDIGMPIIHKSVKYNCRVICLNRNILMIRPKIILANDGNYRERRYFAAYQWTPSNPRPMEQFQLPEFIRKITQSKDRYVPFGIGIVEMNDATVTCEMCEELFVSNSPHTMLTLNGAEIIGNGSGSHHQLRKLDVRIDLILGATSKCGGVYLYSNQQGCDGGRLYFDGCSMIVSNGTLLAQGSQFSMNDVEVVFSTVNLDNVQTYRSGFGSRNDQAALIENPIPRVSCDIDLCKLSNNYNNNNNMRKQITRPMESPSYHIPEEEIGYGPASWLWDYLRRSGASGFLLPLSGGADSASTCAIVGIMCKMVIDECNNCIGNNNNTDKKNLNHPVLKDVACICGFQEDDFNTAKKQIPTAKEFANRIMHTCFMGTTHSSNATRSRAKQLADEIGVYHCDANMNPIIEAFENVFETMTSKRAKFVINGGTYSEDLALQNIQARSRMVYAYQIAQLLPWVRSEGKRSGFLLVLGSANVDEALRGYFTKYDCSSADVNPIGGVSKTDLKLFLKWAGNKFNWKALLDVLNAAPTAELRPQKEIEEGETDSSGRKIEHAQTDESEMGMTYDELSVFGRLRKIQRHGPYSMVKHLITLWGPGTSRNLSIEEIARKVKHFFKYYAMNRHKMTTITPSYHAENYSPDDNRYDLRQFLYPIKFHHQFNVIDEYIKELLG